MYKSIFIAFLVLIVSHFFATKAEADLYYDTYQGTGAYPTFPGNGGSLTYPTALSSGTVTGIDFNWSSGAVLDSGQTDRVIVHFYGYITIPDTGSQDIQFYLYADDGVYMKLDSTVVINDWQEQGAGTWNYVSTDQTLTGGSTYYLDMWMYENGGGAAVKLYWDQTGSVAIVPTSVYATTYTPPSTSTVTGSSPGISGSQSTEITSARTRASTYNSNSDNSVYIDQAGDNNTVTITQQGTAGNHIRGIDGASAGVITGDSNTIEIMQGSPNTTDPNLIELSVVGSTNDILLYQDRVNGTGAIDTVATGGHTISLDLFGDLNDIDVVQSNNTVNQGHYVGIDLIGDSNVIDVFQANDYSKKLFSTVTGNSNLINVIQKGDSSKYAEIELIGNGHLVDLTQQGLGNHDASISLTYGSASSSVTLDQNSSLDQSYSLEQTCYTIGGCSATVTQN